GQTSSAPGPRQLTRTSPSPACGGGSGWGLWRSRHQPKVGFHPLLPRVIAPHPIARPVTVRQVLVEKMWLGGEQLVEGERRVPGDAHSNDAQPEARHRLVVFGRRVHGAWRIAGSPR